MKVTNMDQAGVRARPGPQCSSEILGPHPALPVSIGASSHFAFQHIYGVVLAY